MNISRFSSGLLIVWIGLLCGYAGSVAASDNSALFTAIDQGDVSEVNRLLQNENFDVNSRNPKAPIAFQTPLALAVSSDHERIAAILLEHGADVNLMVGFWRNISPVYLAVQKGNLSLVKTLVGAGAKLEPNQWTNMKEILSSPIDLLKGDVVDLRRPPSLLEAAKASDNQDLVQFLEEKGAL